MRSPEDAVLKIIHATMLGGTLLFFAVVLFVFGGRETEQTVPALRWAWFAFAVAAVFAAGFVRGRLVRDSDDDQVRATGIVIWALAEGAALLGMVSTIVTGEIAPAIGATLVAVFLMVHHRPSHLR